MPSIAKQLSEMIEQKRKDFPALSTSECFVLVRKENPDLYRKFSQEIGFTLRPEKIVDVWVPVE